MAKTTTKRDPALTGFLLEAASIRKLEADADRIAGEIGNHSRAAAIWGAVYLADAGYNTGDSAKQRDGIAALTDALAGVSEGTRKQVRAVAQGIAKHPGHAVTLAKGSAKQRVAALSKVLPVAFRDMRDTFKVGNGGKGGRPVTAGNRLPASVNAENVAAFLKHQDSAATLPALLAAVAAMTDAKALDKLAAAVVKRRKALAKVAATAATAKRTAATAKRTAATATAATRKAVAAKAAARVAAA